MGSRLDGKIALITGAGGGIGSEMAQLFAAEGAAVAANDVDASRLELVVSKIRASGGRVEPVVADISSSTQVSAMVERARQAFGGLDILVNNAFAAVNDITITDLEEAAWDQTIDVCLKGPFLCTKYALPLLKERGGGSVITISSVNALMGVSETAYTAAKGGLISMMRLVAAEYGCWKIRSNIICPGTIATQVSIDYWTHHPPSYEKLLELYPLQRIGQPLEVAQYALFLASDESAFVTGAVHVIDGGLTAGHKFEMP